MPAPAAHDLRDVVTFRQADRGASICGTSMPSPFQSSESVRTRGQGRSPRADERPRRAFEELEGRRLLTGLVHTVVTLPEARDGVAVAAMDHEVLFAGGSYDSTALGTAEYGKIDIYHTSTGR